MSLLPTANLRPSGLPAPFPSSSRVPPALHPSHCFLLGCPSCLKECRLSEEGARLQTRIISLGAMWHRWNVSWSSHIDTQLYLQFKWPLGHVCFMRSGGGTSILLQWHPCVLDMRLALGSPPPPYIYPSSLNLSILSLSLSRSAHIDQNNPNDYHHKLHITAIRY